MRRATVLVLLAIAAPACRQPMAIDTSGAKFIPAPVAVDNLRKLLPEAMVVGCTAPKAIFRQEEIKEWKIDAEAIEFHVEKQSPFRVAFAEITETRAEKLFGGFQVRLFTPASADPKKEHYSFNFRDEPPARRAAELIDALRVKK